MTRFSSASVIAAAALAVAACSSTAVVSQYYSPIGKGYTRADLNYAATFGPIPVYVRGSPFASDPGNAGIVEALQRHITTPNLRFVPVGAPGTQGYRLILAFGDFTPGANYCGGDPNFPLSGTLAGGTNVSASFCLGNYLYGQAHVANGPSRDPRDPTFDAMMEALALELFTPF
jgi:hypothetical protein